jgi:ParB family chromosome partitioning protein
VDVFFGDRDETAGQAGGDTGGLLPVPGAHFAEIPVDRIDPNPKQPRQVFDEDEMAELVNSIKEIGVLQPVVVRSAPGSSSGGADARYELIMGERRWRASEQAGLATVPAIVRDTADDDLLRDALLENLHRSQLNPLEEAAAYQQLLDDFGCTHEELAARIGRSRPQISNTLRLLRLPPLVQRRVAAGVLSAGHARALLALDDAAAMERLAQRIVAEGLSVRSVEEIVALGEDKPATARKPRAGTRMAVLDDLAARLSDRLDTRVKIALGRRKGRLTVEFATVDDLQRIVQQIAPGEDAQFPKNQ